MWSFQYLLHVSISQKPGNCFYSWHSTHWYQWSGEKWLLVHWMIAVELAGKTDFDQNCVPKWYQNISAVRKKSARFLEEIKLWRRWLLMITHSLLVWPTKKDAEVPKWNIKHLQAIKKVMDENWKDKIILICISFMSKELSVTYLILKESARDQALYLISSGMFMTVHSAEKEGKSLVREVDFILWQCVFPNTSFCPDNKY